MTAITSFCFCDCLQKALPQQFHKKNSPWTSPKIWICIPVLHSIKTWMGPSQRTPFSKLRLFAMIDTQGFFRAPFLDRGPRGSDRPLGSITFRYTSICFPNLCVLQSPSTHANLRRTSLRQRPGPCEVTPNNRTHREIFGETENLAKSSSHV